MHPERKELLDYNRTVVHYCYDMINQAFFEWREKLKVISFYSICCN